MAGASSVVKPLCLRALHGVGSAAGAAIVAANTALRGLATGLGLLVAGASSVAKLLGLLALFSVAATYTGAFLAGRGLITVLSPVWTGLVYVLGSIHRSLTVLMGLLLWLGESVGRSFAYAGRTLLQGLLRPVLFASQQLWMAASTIGFLLGWLMRSSWRLGLAALQDISGAIVLLATMMWTGAGVVPDVGRAASWLVTDRKGVFAMSDSNLTRQRVLSLIGTLWVLGTVGLVIGWTFWPAAPEPTVEVEHWATGHLMSSTRFMQARRVNTTRVFVFYRG